MIATVIKRQIMKKFLPFLLLLPSVLVLPGCYKKIDTPQGPDNTIILAYPTGNTANTLSSGLDHFKNALLNFSLNDETDTLLISVNLIGNGIPNAAGKDINIAIGVDSSLVAAYNGDVTHQADTTNEPFALMPSPYYSLVDTTGTIAAGQNQVNFKVVFYPSRFDITQTGYLLPVSIVNASGGSLSQDMKTVYFHIYKDPFPPFNRASWSVLDEDCQELVGEGAGNGAGINCIDGNSSTYWHTQWDVSAPPTFPHWIKIDMGETQTLHGFSFLPRQNGGNKADQFKDIVIMASDDGTNWQQAGQFSLDDISTQQKLNLTNPVPGMRYFEVIVNSNFDTNPWTNVAEIYAF